MRDVAPSSGGTVDPSDEESDLSVETLYNGSVIIQKPTATVTVDGMELLPTKITANTNRWSEAGEAEVAGLWQHEDPPAKDGELQIDLNDITVFTGDVKNVTPEEGDSVTITGVDAIKKLLKTKIRVNFDDAYLGEMIDKVMGFVPDVEYEHDFPRPVKGSPNFSKRPLTEIINQITRLGDVLWWIDTENVLQIKDVDSEIHKLDPHFIEEEPTAGEEESPYQKVIVYGESPASHSASDSQLGGHGTGHIIAKRKISASAGSGEPVYRHESNQIRTKEQAQIAAEAILKEFRMQRASGNIGIIGEGAPIRPFDVIEMPEELNNEQYLVSGIKHTFSNRDGFISDVNCGGLIDA